MSELSQRNTAFRAFLEGLNPAQSRAVQATEGPVLVIAGPGTGKTHILTARIGKILLDTDTRPQNILCLTFTDAAVSAMRQRLLERIGPEAHRVPIFTFHAFCNRVIQENLDYFSRADIEPVSDLERIEIVRELLSKLPPEHPLRDGQTSTFQFESHLRDLFSTMKKEGWTPGFVIKKIETFLEELPQNPDYVYQRNNKYGQKGEPKLAQVAAITERLHRLRSAADLYPKYLAAMTRAGRYEYEDMLLWVIRAFERNEALLRTYQERYQYLMVDEYQDTNGAQNNLLSHLLDFWESPNIFIVGDDDQSIYEFQGARLQNLLDFQEKYHHALQTIVLTENYRSTQAILDASSRVIVNNQLRAVNALEPAAAKRLHAHTGVQSTPQVHVYENRLHELADVVLQIENLVQQGTSPSEIAVLYARHRQGDRVLGLLQKKGIPCQTKRPTNILNLPLIQYFRELLRYLHEESVRPFSGEGRLFRLLHAAFWDLKALDLTNIALRSTLLPEGGAGSIRTALQQTDNQPLAGLSTRLESWIIAAQNLPLPELVERLYTQSGLLAYALAQPDKILYLQALHSFLAFVQAEATRNPRATSPVPFRSGAGSGLARLLTLLDSLDANDLSLPLRQPVQIGAGVQLLSAHAAKGLEFEHVFLFDCTEDAWEKSGGGNNRRFGLPPTLTLSGAEDELEARRRLFYVAMTRAKRQLNISYSTHSEEGKTLTQTRFVEETALPKQPIAVPLETLVEAQTLLLLESALPAISLPEPALIDELLRDFTLSVSSLNRFLRCPLAFYYTDLLKIPETESEYGIYGQVMHSALQQFFQKKTDPGQLFPAVETLLSLFEQEMERRKNYFADTVYQQRLAFGKTQLRGYYFAQLINWRRRAIAERRVDRVEINGVPVNGVLDKIEWLDNDTLRIVDYKTGTPDRKKTDPPSEKQPYGSDYWRQLAFYRLLLEHARIYTEPVRRTAISWLEPDKKGNFLLQEIHHTGEELHFVENLLLETYTKIKNREFSVGCGKEDCIWCRMHRDAIVPMEPFGKEEECLDDGGR